MTGDGSATVRKRRSPNLQGERTRRVLELIARIGPIVTWDAVIAAVEAETGHRYTRQALFGNDAIRLAFATRKRGAPPKGAKRPRSAELQRALERIASLTADLELLKRRDQALTLKFLTWAYNANNAGLTEERLEKPLPGR